MAAITRKIDQVEHIPVDAFPCVITFRNEIISDISDNFIEQNVCEYKPHVDKGIIVVTDASVIGERGTWAAIVTTRKGKELYRDQGIMSSPKLSSYRAELQGCKGALLLLNKFDKEPPRILLCNNMSAILSLNKLRNHLSNVNQSDYDILLEIKELIQPTISFQHVKGHQGTELSDKFNLQTNLNILMDSRAKRMQQVAQHIPDWAHQNKFKENYDNILWDSFTFACQNYNPKKGVLKMIHNIAPTQITLHRRHLSHDM
jgi:ribonuclease HI